MSTSCARSGRQKVLARIAACSVLALIAVIAFSARHASAAPNGPLIVQGIVYDDQGNPLDGAHVVVTDLRTHASGDYGTFGGGFYYVSISGGGQWDVGDTIEVVATAPGLGQAANSAVTTVDTE